MARTPDKPGTYRVKPKRDGWAVSGVTREGRRVRTMFPTEGQARTAGVTLFGGEPPPPSVQATSLGGQTVQLDDWGLPVNVQTISDDTLKSVGASLGVAVPSSAPSPPPLVSNPERDQKARARAKTICEFLGVGVASADVWVARKLTKSIGKDPVNPSAKQVAGLATAWQEALADVMADRTIGPWTMAILLSLALPASMMLQSPKTPEKVAETPKQEGQPLRSVV